MKLFQIVSARESQGAATSKEYEPSSSQRPMMITTRSCPICDYSVAFFEEATILQRYQAVFGRCESCGFIFIENPTWLSEAYAERINIVDTGYVARNIWCAGIAAAFIELFLDPNGLFLDFAAGYGLFVRLMRDRGYDFVWSDKYCSNLFARGFEGSLSPSCRYEAITAFEVLEHLISPVAEFGQLVARTDCVICTTTLLPEPTPRSNEWWYYGLEQGQHVSFYTRRSLEHVAQRFGFKLTSDDQTFHVFTKGAIASNKFRLLKNRVWRKWVSLTRRRIPKTEYDYKRLAGERSRAL